MPKALVKNKMVTKPCPDCDQQIPVACKTCSCGFSFFNQKRSELDDLKKFENVEKSVDSQKKDERPDEENFKLRRTERTKLRPDFYNSGEMDKKTRRPNGRRRRAISTDHPRRKNRAVMLKPTISSSRMRMNYHRKHQSFSESSVSVSRSGNYGEDDYDDEYDQDMNDSNGGEDDTNGSGSEKRRRGRPTYGNNKNGGVIREEAVYENLSTDKVFQYSVILADINRKIGVTQASKWYINKDTTVA